MKTTETNNQQTRSGNKNDDKERLICWTKPGVGLRAGMLCPRCRKAEIEYNGLLQLVCPKCGLTEMGANT